MVLKYDCVGFHPIYKLNTNHITKVLSDSSILLLFRMDVFFSNEKLFSREQGFSGPLVEKFLERCVVSGC